MMSKKCLQKCPYLAPQVLHNVKKKCKSIFLIFLTFFRNFPSRFSSYFPSRFLSQETTMESGEEEDSSTTTTVRDVDFFLCLNHTRLLTSQLRWRPFFLHDLKVRCFFFTISANFFLRLEKFLRNTLTKIPSWRVFLFIFYSYVSDHGIKCSFCSLKCC